jgi:FkbM family methyltransferase
MQLEIDNNIFEVEINTTPHDTTHWMRINSKQWEPETFELFKLLLNKQKSYIDLGAHIGMTALYSSTLSKHCYAIEPDDVAAKALRNNIKLNSISNITVHEIAINNYTGTMQLGSVAQGNSMSSVFIKHNVFDVPCQTIETFFVENAINDCNFIKIDVEGAELLILPQAKSFLKNLNIPILLSIHTQQFPNISDMDIIIDSLSDFKYLYENGERTSLASLNRILYNTVVLCTNTLI